MKLLLFKQVNIKRKIITKFWKKVDILEADFITQDEQTQDRLTLDITNTRHNRQIIDSQTVDYLKFMPINLYFYTFKGSQDIALLSHKSYLNLQNNVVTGKMSDRRTPLLKTK